MNLTKKTTWSKIRVGEVFAEDNTKRNGICICYKTSKDTFDDIADDYLSGFLAYSWSKEALGDNLYALPESVQDLWITR